jgi:nitroreductase
MEMWDAVRARRNVRQFTDQPIATAHLDRILEAGWRSPSSMNQQPWDFILCTDRPQLEELSKLSAWAQHVAGAAAAIALIAPDSDAPDENESLEFDLGQAAMSMMLAAADLGIGSCHAAVEEQDSARRLLGYPQDRLCAMLISLGYPADRLLAPIERPKRRPFDEVVHRGHW